MKIKCECGCSCDYEATTYETVNKLSCNNSRMERAKRPCSVNSKHKSIKDLFNCKACMSFLESL